MIFERYYLFVWTPPEAPPLTAPWTDVTIARGCYFASLKAACAAARRAIGTRNGEQLT
jgi:hypothetical protein